MARKQLSPHFYLDEFHCRDGSKVPSAAVPALEELCKYQLEPLRKKYGPARVNSGYRTRSYNASIGGATFSQHIYDEHPGSVAADVTFSRGTPSQWARSARWRFRSWKRWRTTQRGGVGYYPVSGFVHVDSGPRRDWEG